METLTGAAVWQQIVVGVKLNTPGQSDGEIHVRVDGSVKGTVTNGNMRGSSSDEYEVVVAQSNFTPTWGGNTCNQWYAVGAPFEIFTSDPGDSAIFADGFESGDYALWNGVGNAEGDCDQEIFTDVAHSGTFSSRSPDTDGSNGFLCTWFIPETDIVYVRQWVYFDPAWSTPNIEGIHLIRISRRAIQPFGVLVRETDLTVPPGLNNLQFFHFAVAGEDGGSEFDFISFQPQLNSGVWRCWEFYSSLNTPGLSDGVFRFWDNGSLLYERTNLNFRGNATEGWNEYNAQSNVGNTQGTPWPLDQWWAVDDVEIYNFQSHHLCVRITTLCPSRYASS